MNMFEMGERLKDFSKDQLVTEMRRPTGSVPQFLVLSELQRRRRVEQAAQADQQPQQTTVADDAIAAAGVPQAGLMQMARALAPKTDMDQNTGAAAMAGGGTVRRMQEGGLSGVSRELQDYVGSGATPATATRPITYQQWQEMSRNERRALGLPESVIGGQNYFNRFGVGMGWNDPETGEPLMDSIPSRVREEASDPDPWGFGALEPRGASSSMAQEDGPRPRPYESLLGFLFPNMSEEQIDEITSGWVEEGLPSTLVDAPVDEFTGLSGTPEVPEGSDAIASVAERQRAAEELYGVGPGMTEGDMLSPDGDLLPPAAEETPDAATPDAADGADGADGAGGTGAGGGLDSDRMLEQDKWLALAQFGLGLMSSREPTLGGAIGEAGQTALGQLREARQQAVERDLANRTLAARSASRPAGLTPSQALTYIQNSIEALSTQMVLTTEPGPRMQIAEQIEALQGQADAIMAAMGYGMGPATTQAAAFDVSE